MNNPDSTIIIPLTKGQSTVIDAIDSDLSNAIWYASEFKRCFYAVRKIYVPGTHQKQLYLHRVILERIIGKTIEKGEVCDHINGQSLDNRRENLRVATRSENARNKVKHSNNTSGYKGVSWHKASGKWVAQISVGWKAIYLGSFDDPKDAYEAYCTAAKEYHGEFARLD